MTTIAIPSMTDSGLESDICAHFGSCEYFTIVKVEDGKVEEVGAISNASPDGEHNCAAPAILLKKKTWMLYFVSGIGGRPLMSLIEPKAYVYLAVPSDAYRDAIQDYNDRRRSKSYLIRAHAIVLITNRRKML